jgi:hypothetical protein
MIRDKQQASNKYPKEYNTSFQWKKEKIIEVNLCDKYPKKVPIAKRCFPMSEIVNINSKTN